MIAKAISKMASRTAARPSGIVAAMFKPVGVSGVVKVCDLMDAFHLTNRKVSLSICTRAKGMLLIEATTGA